MDNVDFLKEVLIALKFELIRYRMAVAALAVLVLFSVLALGWHWQSMYVSHATLAVEVNKIFQPLLKGKTDNSKIDHLAQATDLITSSAVLEEAARKLGYIDDQSSVEDVGEVISVMKSGIEIQNNKNRKNFLDISFSSADASVSYETLKVLVELVVEHHRLATKAEEQSEYEFYSKQVKIYEERLIQSEDAIREFKLRSKELDEDAAQDRVAKLTQEIQDLKLGIQETETKIDTTRSQLGNESEYLGIQGRLFNLKQQRFTLQNELSSLRMQFQESYPDIVSIKQQLNEIDSQIKSITDEYGAHITTFGIGEQNESNPEVLYDELRRELADSERQLKAQKQRLVSLEGLLEEQYERISVVAANQVELADLLRDYNVTKDTHAELLSRKENAEISVAGTKIGQGLTYRVVNEPSFPLGPSGLTFKHFLIVAPVLAMGAPIGLLLALIILDPRVRTPSNLSQGTLQDFGVLAVIPHYHSMFSHRLLRKDMLILSIAAAVSIMLFVYIAVLGLSA